MSKYRKFLIAIAAAITSALPAAITDGAITPDEWRNIVLLGVGAAQVWCVTNNPVTPYAKSVAAAIMATATLLVSLIGDGITSGEFGQLGVAVLGAVLVREVPNASATEGANRS